MRAAAARALARRPGGLHQQLRCSVGNTSPGACPLVSFGAPQPGHGRSTHQQSRHHHHGTHRPPHESQGWWLSAPHKSSSMPTTSRRWLSAVPPKPVTPTSVTPAGAPPQTPPPISTAERRRLEASQPPDNAGPIGNTILAWERRLGRKHDAARDRELEVLGRFAAVMRALDNNGGGEAATAAAAGGVAEGDGSGGGGGDAASAAAAQAAAEPLPDAVAKVLADARSNGDAPAGPWLAAAAAALKAETAALAPAAFGGGGDAAGTAASASTGILARMTHRSRGAAAAAAAAATANPTTTADNSDDGGGGAEQRQRTAARVCLAAETAAYLCARAAAGGGKPAPLAPSATAAQAADAVEAALTGGAAARVRAAWPLFDGDGDGYLSPEEAEAAVDAVVEPLRATAGALYAAVGAAGRDARRALPADLRYAAWDRLDFPGKRRAAFAFADADRRRVGPGVGVHVGCGAFLDAAAAYFPQLGGAAGALMDVAEDECWRRYGRRKKRRRAVVYGTLLFVATVALDSWTGVV